MHHTVYLTRNNINRKFYIGAHSTDNPFDDYLGSGVILKKAIKKYGVEEFTKNILFDFDNQQDMFNMEKLIVDTVLGQSDCYNVGSGGIGTQKGLIRSKEHSEKISQSLMGRKLSQDHKQKVINFWTDEERKKQSERTKKQLQNWTDEQKKYHSNAVSESNRKRNSPNKGRKWSDDYKQKMSIATQGENNGMFGKIHGDRSKLKMSLSQKMSYAKRHKNFLRLKELQKEYKKFFGTYNEKFIGENC